MSRGRLIAAAVAVAGAGGLAVALWWSPAARPPTAVPPAAERIEGRVVVAPGAGPVPAGATVVVYAYSIDGAQAPLAIFRQPATALPLEFRLDDSLAPGAEHRLSGVRQLVIGARLGAGGDALSQVGDWLAASQKVAPGTQGVQLVLQPPPK
jgi:cytochrome c-type biogenesis protein CcmH